MKLLWSCAFVIFLSLVGENYSYSANISVTSKIDKDKIYIGERLKYTIKVITPDDVEIKLPDIKGKVDNLIVVSHRRREHKFFRKKTVIGEYILTSYKTGSYKIPSLEVKYRLKGDDKWRSITTQEVSLEVKGVVGESLTKKTIRDIKGPLNYGLNLIFIIILIAILLFAGGVSWIFWKKRKHKMHVTPLIPAHMKAYAALDELERKNLVAEGRIKEFYSILSGIVRRYIEDRFSIHAPRMSTEEFLDYVRGSRVLSSEERLLLEDFLHQSDMVKFARYIPEEKEIVKSMQLARKFIEKTREREDGVA